METPGRLECPWMGQGEGSSRVSACWKNRRNNFWFLLFSIIALPWGYFLSWNDILIHYAVSRVKYHSCMYTKTFCAKVRTLNHQGQVFFFLPIGGWCGPCSPDHFRKWNFINNLAAPDYWMRLKSNIATHSNHKAPRSKSRNGFGKLLGRLASQESVHWADNRQFWI